MAFIEKLKRRFGCEPEKPIEKPTAGYFTYVFDGSSQVIEPGKQINICAPCGHGISSLSINPTFADTIELKVYWEENRFDSIQWGIIEDHELKFIESKGREDWVKVKKFGIGLTQSSLHRHADSYQVLGSPLTFSLDFKTAFFNGQPLLFWTPTTD
jgi:hypothetical protein